MGPFRRDMNAGSVSKKISTKPWRRSSLRYQLAILPFNSPIIPVAYFLRE